MKEGYWVATTMYLFNKLAAVDTDKKVSKTIDFRIKNAVLGAANKYEYYKHKFHFNLTRDSMIGDLLDLEFPSMKDRHYESAL